MRCKSGKSIWNGDEALTKWWSVEPNVDVPILGRMDELVVGLNKVSWDNEDMLDVEVVNVGFLDNKEYKRWLDRLY